MRIPGRLRGLLPGSAAQPPLAEPDPFDGEPGPAAAGESAAENARILRGTRLRLMAVSGAVTLVILVVLGASAYLVVSRSINDSEQGALKAYLDRHLPSQATNNGPEAAELSGEGANLFEMYITPSGAVQGPRGSTSLPAGLPNAAGIAAARSFTDPTQIDQRNVTAADGTNWTIVTVQAIGPTGPGWLIQIVQNRTADYRLLGTLSWALLLTGGLALLASLLAGYLYAGRALVPIRASMARREAALQRQREFAANASHELRTPLTVIGASVEDLKRNSRSPVADVGEALGDIEAEVRHMTALVEDMLLLARTDSGVVQVDHVPLDLGDVAVEAASMLTTLGQERHVNVVLDPRPAAVTGDPLRLRQLVTILVDNAIRHSPAGATVEVWIRAEAGAAVLEVADHGPGIKPEDLPRLFERFWRADDAPAGGTGLGLAIASWIASQHGGTIEALNRPEGGARFVVRLPLTVGGGALSFADPTPDWGPPAAHPESPAGLGPGAAIEVVDPSGGDVDAGDAAAGDVAAGDVAAGDGDPGPTSEAYIRTAGFLRRPTWLGGHEGR